MESRRIFLIQLFLIIWKALLWWIISAKRKHDETPDHADILLEVKAGGKRFETRMTITNLWDIPQEPHHVLLHFNMEL